MRLATVAVALVAIANVSSAPIPLSDGSAPHHSLQARELMAGHSEASLARRRVRELFIGSTGKRYTRLQDAAADDARHTLNGGGEVDLLALPQNRVREPRGTAVREETRAEREEREKRTLKIYQRWMYGMVGTAAAGQVFFQWLTCTWPFPACEPKTEKNKLPAAGPAATSDPARDNKQQKP